MWRLILVTGLSAALVACQASTPTVSLEEAKQITAKFEGPSFTSPPKTISDITAILDQEPQADLETLAKARARAIARPPLGARDKSLADFYWKRWEETWYIADAKQTIAELTEALRLAKGVDWLTNVNLLGGLANAEVSAGNVTDSIRHLEEGIALTPQGSEWASFWLSHLLIVLYALVGDIESAERTLAAEEQALLNLSASWHARWGSRHRAAVLRSKATIMKMKGRFADAELLYRSSIKAREESIQAFRHDKIHSSIAVYVANMTRTEFANNLVQQGQLVEAEIEARKALIDGLNRLGRYSFVIGYSVKTLSNVISEQGRHEEAEKLARAAIDIYRKVGATEDSWQLAIARGRLAETLVNQGRWKEALAEYEAIKKALASDPETFKRQFGNDLSRILSLIGAGRLIEARSVAEANLKYHENTVGKEHYFTAVARGVLAMALAKVNEHEAALGEFAKSIPVLLSRSRQSDDESTTKVAREQRHKLILESYIGLLADVRGTELERESGIDATVEAFRLAEVARSQAVQRALSLSSARAALTDPELMELARREQDTKKQIAALYGTLANALSRPVQSQNAEGIRNLEVAIDKLQKAQVALTKEIDARFPEYADLINPKPSTFAEARAFLRPGEALIATYVGEDRSYVWAVPKSGTIAFSTVNLGHRKLESNVALLRSALEPNARTIGDIPEFDLTSAHFLYKALLEPVRDGWKDANSLLVVAHGPLGYLPLTVLPTNEVKLESETAPLFSNYRKVPWLARTHAVTVLPSVASLRTLRAIPPGDSGRKPFAGFGDPYFSEAQLRAAAPRSQSIKVAIAHSLGAIRGLRLKLRSQPKTEELDSAQLAMLPRLPNTADEVRSLALAMKADLTESVFLGKDANEARVKSMDLSGFKVLAFATHGLVPGDLDGLSQPALALTPPKVSGTPGDGLLTMSEILGLKLNADWVVLSACNTGSGQGAGAEAVSGLGRAFFYAGTRALLVSNWPVHSASARDLTTALFRRQAADSTLSRAEALRRSMLKLIDGGTFEDATGKDLFSYAHPLFWAPFSLVGDGGSGQPAS